MIHAREDYNRIQDPEGKIGEDEPVFLVRAQDMAAPATVMAWAEQAQRQGASHEIVQLAKLHVDRMIRWQEQNGCKVADLPNAPIEDPDSL